MIVAYRDKTMVVFIKLTIASKLRVDQRGREYRAYLENCIPYLLDQVSLSIYPPTVLKEIVATLEH